MPDHETPLRGRGSERALLQARLDAARQHGHGCVVLLTGTAGSGKSRLLHEACLLASSVGAEVARVSGDPDAHVIPHGSAYLFLHGLDGVPRDQSLITLSLTYLRPDIAREIQTIWMKRGFDKGPADGVVDARFPKLLVDYLRWANHACR